MSADHLVGRASPSHTSLVSTFKPTRTGFGHDPAFVGMPDAATVPKCPPHPPMVALHDTGEQSQSLSTGTRTRDRRHALGLPDPEHHAVHTDRQFGAPPGGSMTRP